MKKTKVLVPALGILCLSMAASITGTVAWFSANAQVTANGMKIAASTDSSLAIAAAKTGTWGNTMDLDAITGRTVMPVSPLLSLEDSTVKAGCTVANADSVGQADVTTVDFYKKGSENQVTNPAEYDAAISFPTFVTSNGAVVDGDEDTYVKEGTFSLANSNYAMDSIFLKLMAAAGATCPVTLDMKVTSTEVGGENIDKALHIGMLVKRDVAVDVENPTTGVVYGADTEDGKADTFLNYDLSDFAAPAADGYEYTRQIPNLLTLAAEKPIEIVTYAWYEGEDADCTSANATIVNNLTIDIAFSKYVAPVGGGLR